MWKGNGTARQAHNGIPRPFAREMPSAGDEETGRRLVVALFE